MASTVSDRILASHNTQLRIITKKRKKRSSNRRKIIVKKKLLKSIELGMHWSYSKSTKNMKWESFYNFSLKKV